jgi:hypothetical protein
MHANHLQINYLARQHQEILPLISPDDPLPSLLALIAEYDGVLQRHESMAGNLGARPLGPILIKRFERLFDGPPRVLKSHGKEGNTVGWLDVVEFAKNKPDQFNLEKSRDGLRVCQFYTKQSRVEITEEDYELIASGMPQKLIPPQPIVEDEEKELGTLEILDKHLSQVVQLADQGGWAPPPGPPGPPVLIVRSVGPRAAVEPPVEEPAERHPRPTGSRSALARPSEKRPRPSRRPGVGPGTDERGRQRRPRPALVGLAALGVRGGQRQAPGRDGRRGVARRVPLRSVADRPDRRRQRHVGARRLRRRARGTAGEVSDPQRARRVRGP